jgi:hypothetical protein
VLLCSVSSLIAFVSVSIDNCNWNLILFNSPQIEVAKRRRREKFVGFYHEKLYFGNGLDCASNDYIDD